MLPESSMTRSLLVTMGFNVYMLLPTKRKTRKIEANYSEVQASKSVVTLFLQLAVDQNTQ